MNKRKPSGYAESKIQQNCVAWFRIQYPQFNMLLFSSLNGVKLKGTPKQRMIEGGRLKREGLVAGVADLFLSIPSGDKCGLYIEMKTEKGTQSKKQKEFELAVIEQGFGYVLCRSLGEFMRTVKSYLETGEY